MIGYIQQAMLQAEMGALQPLSPVRDLRWELSSGSTGKEAAGCTDIKPEEGQDQRMKISIETLKAKHQVLGLQNL